MVLPTRPPNRYETLGGRPVESPDRRREQMLKQAELLSKQNISPEALETLMNGKKAEIKEPEKYREYAYIVKPEIAYLYNELSTYSDEWRLVSIQHYDNNYHAHLEKMVTKEVKLSLSNNSI